MNRHIDAHNVFPPIMRQEDIDRAERIQKLNRKLAIPTTANRVLAAIGVAFLVVMIASLAT